MSYWAGRSIVSIAVAGCCIAAMGCTDSMTAARRDATERLAGLVWVDDPERNQAQDAIDGATTKEQVATAISRAETLNSELEADYWKCAKLAPQNMVRTWIDRTSSVTDGRDFFSAMLELASDGTAALQERDHNKLGSGDQTPLPAAQWHHDHIGHVTGWSSDLTQVVEDKQTLGKPSELHTATGSCKVTFHFNLVTDSGTEEYTATISGGAHSPYFLHLTEEVYFAEPRSM